MNPAMLTNVNTKSINQTKTSSKSLEIKDEDIEVSYKEVLKEEISAVSKQSKRSRSNQGKSKTNNFQNPDTINPKDVMKLNHFIEPNNRFRPLPPPPPRPWRCSIPGVRRCSAAPCPSTPRRYSLPSTKS